MAHGRDLHHCPRARSRTSKRTPSSDTVANSTRRRASCTVHAGVRARGAAVWAVVVRSRRSSPSSRTFPKRQPSRGNCADTYAAPSRAATAHIVEACGLQLPVGPATALEEVVARELCSGSSFRTGTWRSGSAPCVERPRCCTARAATYRQCPEAWWRCCRHSARQSTWTLMRSWRA
ncbi:hypothetical protein ERJ75_000818400 [Trypanosoma vivax]|nr:hypothetical protein ERJ75_000818400 [Trypanosoma vivax]